MASNPFNYYLRAPLTEALESTLEADTENPLDMLIRCEEESLKELDSQGIKATRDNIRYQMNKQFRMWCSA